MNKIDWCLKQKKGLELVEPNMDIARAYLFDADESLLAMGRNKGKWKIVMGYYACYNALYSLLMKTGIKCEIHDCTLVLMNFFGFNQEQIKFLKKLKELRIDVQYYLKPAQEIDAKKIKKFVVDCKVLAKNLSENEIEKMRRLVKND